MFAVFIHQPSCSLARLTLSARVFLITSALRLPVRQSVRLFFLEFYLLLEFWIDCHILLRIKSVSVSQIIFLALRFSANMLILQKSHSQRPRFWLVLLQLSVNRCIKIVQNASHPTFVIRLFLYCTNIIPEGFHDEHIHMRISVDNVFQTHMHTFCCELFGQY